MKRLFRTNAFRMAATYFILFAGSVLALLAFFYLSTEDFIRQQAATTVNAEIRGLSDQYEQGGLTGLIDVINARIAGQRIRATLYLVTDDQLRPIAGNLPVWPTTKTLRPGWFSFSVDIIEDGETETEDALASTLVLRDGYRVLVGRDLRDVQAFRHRLNQTLAWAVVLTLALGVLGGVSSTRNILRRVEAVNRTSERIIRGDLSQRISLNGSGDEFDQLSVNLNTMLDRIERLMTGMRQVTDNIAHDLRTPLARLRTRLEIILLEGPDAARSIEALRETIVEADRLLATFNGLLKIAEAEAGSRRKTMSVVDLAEIAHSMAELYEPLAEEKGVTLAVECGSEIFVNGDRPLLAQLVANLLDNALKYSAIGPIRLAVYRIDGLARIEVADSGPGIPPQSRDAVFDRFVRLEASRSAPGNGLGLSLVRAVATLHGGNVLLEDNNSGSDSPGLKVIFTVPIADEQASQSAHR